MTEIETLLAVVSEGDATDVSSLDDAVMRLHSSDDPRAEAALIALGCRVDLPDLVLASCGESLGEIWIRQGRLNSSVLSLLQPVARSEAQLLYDSYEPRSRSAG